MTTSAHPLFAIAPQTRLAWRFIWRSTWPYMLLWALLLVVIAFVFRAWLDNDTAFLGSLPVLCHLVILPPILATRARRQLATLREQGGVLTPDAIAFTVTRTFTSPLGPLTTFDLCADRLSSIGMAEALGFARPAAFCHNPFTGTITIGRVRPFWYAGAVKVTITQHAEDTAQVQVRRVPGLRVFAPQLGEALRTVDQVCTELERTIKTRRAALDAAVRAQDLARSAMQAQLHVLQAQIEPHFLYNTLANLKYLIRTDQDRAQTMVDHLVGYLQSAVPDMRTETSTVQRELALAAHYLHLMQIRMGDRLRFRIDADPALDTCPVPPAMLVSLLENAIKHGLEQATRPGTIVVSAQRVNGLLELAVRDDGAGFNDAAAGAGLGLENIHQRLQLLYGGRATVRVAPNADHGVQATLHFPLEDAPCPPP